MAGRILISEANLQSLAELQAGLKKENALLKEGQRKCYERVRELTLQRDALQRERDALQRKLGGNQQLVRTLNQADVRIAYLEAKLRANGISF